MSSRKSTKKCKRGSHGVKTHMRNGKLIRSHCSRNRKGSRKTTSSSRKVKKLICPPGTIKVKSHRHGSKRVKTYCRKEAVKKIKEIEKEIEQLEEQKEELEEEVQEQDCSSFSNKANCEEATDYNRLRRCRYNMTTRSCETLPMNLRMRATLGVGGMADYKKYEAPERRKLGAERYGIF